LRAIAASKTRQLYLLLKERIASGDLAAGERLPGEPSLALRHNLSRVTVRRALEGLARDGLIRRTPGSGTFVRAPSKATAISGDLTNLLSGLIAMGESTDVRLLAFAVAAPPPAVAEALGLPSGELTQQAIRIRLIKGAPLSHLTTHVPAGMARGFGEADLRTTPLLTLLERAGAIAARAEQTISATLAGPDTAAALEVEIGAPLLSLTRVVFDRAGRGIEHLQALYRPDMYRFHMELTRSGDAANGHWRPAAPDVSRNTTVRRETAARRRKS
jgi:GntR family transcriptional regulator